jgi:hypothetical protein
LLRAESLLKYVPISMKVSSCQLGLDNIYFGWIGALEEKKGHYYIINGPTFLIEFDNYGGPRNSANHIHAIWREKGNEYGEDVLKKHYLTEKH